MKNLQSNYTTPEQSRQLLELGVPADSADCYLYKVAEYGYRVFIRQPYFNESVICGGSIPCWSVGRLIEIFLLCSPYRTITINKSDKASQVVASFFMVQKDKLFDFSKLR